MAWQDEMVIILRGLVGDLAEETYSSDTLEQIIVIAGFQVCQEMGFTTYTFSAENVSMTPDPTASATKDNLFVDLCTLKAACILDRNSARLAADQGIFVKDGASAIDLRGKSDAAYKLLLKGWCAVYDQRKIEFATSQNDGIGYAIMTPYRYYAENYLDRMRE